MNTLTIHINTHTATVTEKKILKSLGQTFECLGSYYSLENISYEEDSPIAIIKAKKIDTREMEAHSIILLRARSL